MCDIYERAIQSTDVDAVEAKASAVKLGYWKDPYVKYYVYEQKVKAPEINRGYFARTQSIEAVVKQFITCNNDSQIISIGSGSDTLYLRLLDQNILPSKFIEIDLAENVMKKISQYQQRKVLSDKLKLNASNIKNSLNIYRKPYYLFSFDLRSDPKDFIQLLDRESNVNFSYPTLFVAECVFVYINTEIVNDILKCISQHFPNSAILSYDPINMTDVFGEMMVHNLKMRHIELNGISACSSKETQKNRFEKANYLHVNVWLISEVYKSFSKSATRRIESIEMLDDPEMMKQLFDHYCLILAFSNRDLMLHDQIEDILSIID